MLYKRQCEIIDGKTKAGELVRTNSVGTLIN